MQIVYRHSAGTYLAGKVPKVMLVMPLSVAVVDDALAQAQSMDSVELA